MLQGEEVGGDRLGEGAGEDALEGRFGVRAAPQLAVGAAEGEVRGDVARPLAQHAQLAAHVADARQILGGRCTGPRRRLVHFVAAWGGHAARR